MVKHNSWVKKKELGNAKTVLKDFEESITNKILTSCDT